jgi:hypothetical protein
MAKQKDRPRRSQTDDKVLAIEARTFDSLVHASQTLISENRKYQSRRRIVKTNAATMASV